MSTHTCPSAHPASNDGISISRSGTFTESKFGTSVFTGKPNAQLGDFSGCSCEDGAKNADSRPDHSAVRKQRQEHDEKEKHETEGGLDKTLDSDGRSTSTTTQGTYPISSAGDMEPKHTSLPAPSFLGGRKQLIEPEMRLRKSKPNHDDDTTSVRFKIKGEPITHTDGPHDRRAAHCPRDYDSDGTAWEAFELRQVLDAGNPHRQSRACCCHQNATEEIDKNANSNPNSPSEPYTWVSTSSSASFLTAPPSIIDVVDEEGWVEVEGFCPWQE